MMHASRRARLAQEKRLRRRITHLPGRDYFQRDVYPQLIIVRLVGHTHGAAAQLPKGTIRPMQHAVVRKLQFRLRGRSGMAQKLRRLAAVTEAG
jgi:hypothetical protein